MTKQYIKIPKVCPICGKPTEIREDGVAKILYCSNPQCDGKLINVINHYASKKGLDIHGLSEKRIEFLIDKGWLGNIKELYSLSNFRDEWVKCAGWGIASVDKILAAIEESRQFNLQKFISALGIPEVGVTVSKDLAKVYGTWENFRNCTFKGLLDINGIGEIMADNILHFDYTEADDIVKNCMVGIGIKNITGSFIEFQKAKQEADEQISTLANMTFVITGKCSIPRAKIQEDIENAGGKVTGSVSAKTSYLVIDDVNSTTGKAKTAREKGIPMISEEELYEMIGG